jgi:hypothetical protein
MLYTVSMMKELNLPESVQPGKHYSFRADMKLNAWALVAVALAVTSRICLLHHGERHLSIRAAIALSPLLPSLFYVLSVTRWIRGMDELQRRIQLEACLFATVGTIFIVTGVSLLQANGMPLPRLQNGLGWEGTFASIIFLYILGNFIANRRYQ